ncbi:NmrA family NAD(P)-binding protein [Nonomuraea sp. FMUSA5-5]|uniref:NmrA family NAD(P)-binding protein n=1 Tax=Nonomuraea composti TaxID=2720023 RepID=A0ABX1B7X2_9ACTN|nr:NmrA family NAD(P)-binding protein [Nonomuraea sp. FMUSA5-5]NJP93909.1 NmrA family NAD(P)-binding protein [Nonomuraea sp. FMUSA5-5]
MIVVSFATSDTGSAVADALLATGEQVRVLGRSRDRLQRYVERGAEAVEARTDDPGSLRAAFAGARAAFVMIAPGIIPGSTDFPAYQRRVIDAFRQALDGLGDRTRIVSLSGWAANHDGACGPVWGLRPLEEALDTLAGAEVTHLRPGWFMENALPMIDEVRATGTAHGLIPADLPLPAIATADIGAVAADLLTGRREAGARTLELQGPRDVTLTEITAAIGRALGRPEARYEQIDAATMRERLLAAGFSPHMADGTTAMTLDVAERRITMLQPRTAETATPTTFEEFLARVLD